MPLSWHCDLSLARILDRVSLPLYASHVNATAHSVLSKASSTKVPNLGHFIFERKVVDLATSGDGPRVNKIKKVLVSSFQSQLQANAASTKTEDKRLFKCGAELTLQANTLVVALDVCR